MQFNIICGRDAVRLSFSLQIKRQTVLGDKSCDFVQAWLNGRKVKKVYKFNRSRTDSYVANAIMQDIWFKFADSEAKTFGVFAEGSELFESAYEVQRPKEYFEN